MPAPDVGSSAKPRVLVIDPIAYQEMAGPIRAQLNALFDTTFLWMRDDKDTYLERHGGEFTAFISRAGLTTALLELLPNLQIIAQTGAGLDGVPLDYIRGRGIALTNARGVLSDDVADIAIGLMLSAARELGRGERLVRSGGWTKERPGLARRANRKTYGIVGMGSIGSAIARRLVGFDGTILYHNRRPVTGSPYAYVADLKAMATQADFLFIATPGGAGTANLVDEDVLRALGPDGIVVNVGRGTTLDEAALLKTLGDGGLGGAGLDVHRSEPHVNPELMKFDSVVLLPHLGSSTVETRMAMHQVCIDNILAHFAGAPLLTPV